MTFSKEDTSAWENSEVMMELEKLAEDVFHPSPEAYQPIDEDQDTWEEESDEERLIDASYELINDLDDNSFEKELQEASNKKLLNGLEKISNDLINKSNIKVAYKVERLIRELKETLLREEKNNGEF